MSMTMGMGMGVRLRLGVMRMRIGIGIRVEMSSELMIRLLIKRRCTSFVWSTKHQVFAQVLARPAARYRGSVGVDIPLYTSLSWFSH